MSLLATAALPQEDIIYKAKLSFVPITTSESMVVSLLSMRTLLYAQSTFFFCSLCKKNKKIMLKINIMYLAKKKKRQQIIVVVIIINVAIILQKVCISERGWGDQKVGGIISVLKP